MQFKFSQDIETLLQKVSQTSLTLQDLLTVTAERGFSFLIALLALPFIFPIPPGLTGVAGAVIALLAGQMALGRKRPWLPPRFARIAFPPALATKLLTQIRGLTRILERLCRPRLLPLATTPQLWRLNGLVIAWLTFLLVLPIPFTNPLPALGILLLAVAMLEADGFLMCLVYGWTASISFGLYLAGRQLWSLVF
jgi:hypothetical protein